MFETYEEAYFAVHNMNGYMYNHRPLQVSFKSFQNSTSSTSSTTNNKKNNDSSSHLRVSDKNINKNISTINIVNSSNSYEISRFYQI